MEKWVLLAHVACWSFFLMWDSLFQCIRSKPIRVCYCDCQNGTCFPQASSPVHEQCCTCGNSATGAATVLSTCQCFLRAAKLFFWHILTFSLLGTLGISVETEQHFHFRCFITMLPNSFSVPKWVGHLWLRSISLTLDISIVAIYIWTSHLGLTL